MFLRFWSCIFLFNIDSFGYITIAFDLSCVMIFLRTYCDGIIPQIALWKAYALLFIKFLLSFRKLISTLNFFTKRKMTTVLWSLFILLNTTQLPPVSYHELILPIATYFHFRIFLVFLILLSRIFLSRTDHYLPKFLHQLKSGQNFPFLTVEQMLSFQKTATPHIITTRGSKQKNL